MTTILGIDPGKSGGPAPVTVTDEDVAEAVEMLNAAYPSLSYRASTESVQNLARYLAEKRSKSDASV